MKYDSQLGDLKNQLASVKNVLVALPASASVDEMAAGLALYLALENAGKQVSIVSASNLLVSHSNLYGIGEIKNEIKASGAGNLILTLEGVVDPQTNTPPALESLDWYPEGENLNLVFKVVPGQRFEPRNIVPKVEGAGLEMVFVVGAAQLDELGEIYIPHQQVFSAAKIINIDNNLNNNRFGMVNIVDQEVATLSEMIGQLLTDLGLQLDGDIATNILTGIYEQTNHLTVNVKADTFMVAGMALQAGGRVPQAEQIAQPSQTQVPFVQQPIVMNQPQVEMINPQPVVPQAEVTAQPQVNFSQFEASQNQYDLSKIFGIPQDSQITNETVQTPQINEAPVQPAQVVPHKEEAPSGEFATSTSGESEAEQPAPDWLVPKIYRGGSGGGGLG